MHEFGPFVIHNAGHMRKFGQTILAFTLQMSSRPREPFNQENATPSPQSLSSKTNRGTYAQVLTKGSGPTGATKATRFSRTETGSASSYPQTLLGQLSELTVSKTPNLTPTTPPPRSSQPAESIEWRPGSPQQKPSLSTGNYPNLRERKRK
jgi:hypothetical protein